MKRTPLFILALVVLSVVIGFLLSKASLIGHVGINLFYKQYKFLRLWWQGALVVLAVYLLLLFIQGRINKMQGKSTARFIQVLAILIALTGLYFTYNDFRHTLTHRLLGERFHLGGYLFWMGWIGISLFYLAASRTKLFTNETNSAQPAEV